MEQYARLHLQEILRIEAAQSQRSPFDGHREQHTGRAEDAVYLFAPQRAQSRDAGIGAASQRRKHELCFGSPP